ncbi:MAG: YfhO family protein, partial [Planctomycetaceae bacterium]
VAAFARPRDRTPRVLANAATKVCSRTKQPVDRFVLFWLSIAILSGLYTSGWLLPLTQHLPGFSYFQGLGRYGLLTTWSVAVLAGSVVDRFLRSPNIPRCLVWTLICGSMWSLCSWYLLGDDVAAVMTEVPTFSPLTLLATNAHGTGPLMAQLQLSVLMAAVIGVSGVLWWLSERPIAIDARVGLIGLVLLTTAVEFWTISRLVTFTQIVATPPLKSLERSPVRQKLLEAAQTRPTLRLFAPGANLPSTLGVSSTPIYLTFGPAEYVDDSLRQPDDWLSHGGITHLLSFESQPLTESMRLIWQGDDPFLNRAWGRSGQPLYLYEFQQSLGRAQLRASDGQALLLNSKLTSFKSRSNAVECEVDLNQRGVLVLLDLDYPGWSVTVDGQPAEPLRIDKLFRGVKLEAGSHSVVWSYRPRSVLVGAAISVVTLLMLAAAAHIRFWHPQRLAWLDEKGDPSRGHQ